MIELINIEIYLGVEKAPPVVISIENKANKRNRYNGINLVRKAPNCNFIFFNNKIEDINIRVEPTKRIPLCAKYAPKTVPNNKKTNDESSLFKHSN